MHVVNGPREINFPIMLGIELYPLAYLTRIEQSNLPLESYARQGPTDIVRSIHRCMHEET